MDGYVLHVMRVYHPWWCTNQRQIATHTHQLPASWYFCMLRVSSGVCM